MSCYTLFSWKFYAEFQYKKRFGYKFFNLKFEIFQNIFWGLSLILNRQFANVLTIWKFFFECKIFLNENAVCWVVGLISVLITLNPKLSYIVKAIIKTFCYAEDILKPGHLIDSITLKVEHYIDSTL